MYRFFILAAFIIVLSSTAYSVDTVIIRDTVYKFDSTTIIATNVAELKAEFYERAIEGLEREKTSANTLIGIIFALFSLASGYAFYSAQKSRAEVEKEIDRIRDQRFEIEKESKTLLGDLKNLKFKIDETRTMLDKVIEEKTGEFDELLQSVKQSSKEMEEKTEAAKKDQIVSPEKIAELIESPDAKKFIEEYEQIVTKYLEIDELQSLPSKLHKTAGMSYLHQKKYKEALFTFQHYLYIIPGDTEANFQCGFCLFELSQFDEAIRYYSMAIISDPDDHLGNKGNSLNNWGVCLISLYKIRRDELQLEQAIEKIKEAIDLAPIDAENHYNLAYAYSLKGQKENMLVELEKAVKLDPKHASVALQDEDFAAYKNDPEFLALVKPSKDDKKSKNK